MSQMHVYNEAKQWLNDYLTIAENPSRHNYAVSQIRRCAEEQRANVEVLKLHTHWGHWCSIPEYEKNVVMIEDTLAILTRKEGQS